MARCSPAVYVCVSKCCKKLGSPATHDLFRAFAPDGVEVEESGCHGQCGSGPNLVASGTLYTGVYKPATAAAILEKECGAAVPAALITAYKEKMRGDQDLRDGRYAKSLTQIDAALASGHLDAFPEALCSAWLSRSEALHRQAAAATDAAARAELLGGAAAAARAAARAAPARRAAWLRLCDALDAAGAVAEALESLQEMEAALAEGGEQQQRRSSGGGGGRDAVVAKKAERLRAKLEQLSSA
ncbi:hypothetical protein JKP88DRAFT_280155 [Tribonema minus]|uniref:Uncharacterized protein n=1 Tax=Tribonema minus TaxID=303371 RepID=A0A836CAY5_9STRA|nr:hypothetical protein JKP88DRAFT_280155 [Tribonema minus]